MKSILIIGIGAGDPDYITVQAVKALNRVDVFLLMYKGPAKHKLRVLREELCRQHVTGRVYRFVEAPSPPRETQPADYRAARRTEARRRRGVGDSGAVQDARLPGAGTDREPGRDEQRARVCVRAL